MSSKKILKSMLQPYFKSIIVVSILSSVGALLEVVCVGLFVPIGKMIMDNKDSISKYISIFDTHIAYKRQEMIIIGVCAVIIRSIILMIKSRMIAKIGASYFATQRKNLFSLFLYSSWEKKSQASAGELQTILTTNVEKGRAVLFSAAKFLSTASQAAIILLSAFILNIYLACSIIIMGILLFLVVKPITNIARKATKVDAKLGVLYSEEILESLNLAQEVEVFSVKDSLKKRVEMTVEKTKEKQVIALFASQVLPIIYQNSVFLAGFAALGVVGMSSNIQIEILGAIILLMLRLVSYTQNLQFLYHEVMNRLPYMHQFSDSVEKFLDAKVEDGDVLIHRFEKLSFENVNFSYGDKSSKKVLNNVSFEVKAGEFIGLIGSSGAGKSTLLQLLLGLYSPEKGTIKVNGIDLKDMKMSSWLRILAFVPQSAALLKGSIKNNVQFYRDWISDENIAQALDEAYLSQRILELKDGVNSELKGEGINLSGGEKQRICIARALAGHPDVLILDEPTSALDTLSEQFIQKSIDRLRGQKTIFAIAHRVSTLDSCDRIMVLDQGNIIAFDTPENLYRDNDFYRQTRQALERENMADETQKDEVNVA